MDIFLQSRRGFSLIELALVLGISGLMVGFVLQSQQSAATEDCYLATQLELKDINGAIQNFARKNERLPMPAARDVGVEGVTYGREAVAASLDVAGTTTWGALPFQALGLAPSYASDCWGNKLTYVVTTALTTNATVGGFLDGTVVGTITVKKDATTNSSTTAAYAVISHGEDKLGAVKSNYSNTASHGWCTGAASLATQNCLATSATVADATFNNGRDAGTAFFDDVIITSGRPQVQGSNVLCWGYNNGIQSAQNITGALGDGTTTNRWYPASVNTSIQFAQLYGNGQSYCALTADGTPYCWGQNYYYQIGNASCNGCNAPNSPSYLASPTLLPGGFKFSTLSQTSTNTCGIVAAGGNGTPGEIRCMGTRLYASSPMMGNSTLAGNYYGIPQPVDGVAASKSFSKLYMSGYNSCALESGTGQAYCWGRASSGQLGNGAPIAAAWSPTLTAGGIAFSKLVITVPSSANYMICGLGTDSKIYCWGNNAYGATGVGHPGYGTGYAAPPAVTFSGGGGSGAAATARVLNGGIVAIDVTAGGSGYTSAPTVSFAGAVTGTYASATAILDSAGSVATVQINPAVYTPVAVSALNFSDVVAIGATVCGLQVGTGSVYCWGGNGNGAVGNNITAATASGTGYTSAPTVSIAGGGGTGATATATFGSGGVSAITLNASGNGYTSTPTVVFTGGGAAGFGASASADMGGPISSFSITPGSGYTPGAYTVSITPGGTAPLGVTPATGCQATVDATGALSTITCSTYGDGYNTATVSLAGLPGDTGAAATVNIAQTRVVNLVLYPNNADVWTPTLVNGGSPSMRSITPQGSAFTGVGTDNKLYSWGSAGGGNYFTGINSANLGVPTLLNAFVKNSTCGGPLSGGSACSTSDSTAASLNFSQTCTSLRCALDSAGNAYLWGTTVGNGAMQTASPTSPVRYGFPAATCPTTPATGVPACNYKWTNIVGVYTSSALTICGLKQP
jgi:type II secretory pathway pseudopilin PulG